MDPGITRARADLLHSLSEWLEEARERHEGTRWRGIHDEGTFLTAWREYYLLTRDAALYAFARERYQAAYKKTKRKWRGRGYWKAQEVHHGAEHFVIYLAWMLELCPDDDRVRAQLRAAAQHIVEQGKKPRPWFDPDTKRFTSLYLGTKQVGNPRLAQDGLNIVEHLRFVYLAWLGLAAGGPRTLADVIVDYSREWAEAILAAPVLPVFLDRDPEDAAGVAEFSANVLQQFTGAAPKELTPRSRIEFHVANGIPHLFLRLHDLTGDATFLRAAREVLAPLVDQLASPYAHPAASLLLALHRRDSLPAFPAALERLAAEWGPVLEDLASGAGGFACSAHLDKVDWQAPEFVGYKYGIGMRADMPRVRVLDATGKPLPPVPSPATLAAVTAITGQPVFEQFGLTYARLVLEEARRQFPDGRRHGCGSRTVSAHCVGHGRNWGAGFVSTALAPFLPPGTPPYNLPPVDL